MLVKTRFVTIVALLLLSIPVSLAQERTWGKAHHKIEMDQVMAEYTEITTSDGLSPQKTRVLYRDSAGVALVIRNTSDWGRDAQGNTAVGRFTSTITLVSTGEQIVLTRETNGTVTVVIGSGSFSYADTAQRPLPQSVKDQAHSMLATNASQAFQEALERLAGVAARHSILLYDLGYELADLFFPGIALGPLTDHTSDPCERVAEFNPSLTPPGAFEQPFGQAWYE